MLARLFPLLLVLLTRDGKLHTVEADSSVAHDSTTAALKPVALAVVSVGSETKVAMLAGNILSFGAKKIPGDFSDVRALAGGEKLFALGREGAYAVDLPSGTRHILVPDAHLHRIAADRVELIVEKDGVVRRVTTGATWKVDGQPIALAAGDGKIWAATKKGPIVEIDTQKNTQRPLVGIGDWWTTLAMTYGEGKLYVVTLSGKIWKIDPGDEQRHAEKTIVAMSGWENALDIAVR